MNDRFKMFLKDNGNSDSFPLKFSPALWHHPALSQDMEQYEDFTEFGEMIDCEMEPGEVM